MPLLSIIIPIYNAAKYLRQSLDSVISQSHLDVCEVILINDGSNDNSLVIIKEYASKYSCIKVIDKDNEGVSATRNRGLDIASGEFIYFMDADDLLHPNFMDVIWPELTRSYVDIIVWQFATFYSTPKYCTIKDVEVQNFSNERKDIFNYLMRYGAAG
jgi:glycosyltransferase involved in cell wall biosynthesis